MWFIEYEMMIRLFFFMGMLLIVGIWELIAPRRPLLFSRAVRWYSNLGLVLINSFVLRLLFPILATGLAILAQERSWGLFNNIQISNEFEVILSLLMMDCVIYLQHAMFHAIPLMWRFHRMHHADLDLDVTSGIRFHPIEIILSMWIKFAVILLVGPSIITVILFEVILNVTAMFNHGNIYIPVKLDRVLRWFVVTPDMHRVHHSVIAKETNTNFGFNFPWWDHIFGTYCDQPIKGHHDMTIGLRQFRCPANLHLHKLLTQPFVTLKKE